MAASMKYITREPEEGKDGLILANFSHGRLNVTEDGSCLQPPQFTYYKHKDQDDKRKKNQRILVAESNSMQYVGQNYGLHAPRYSSNCKYLVGILNKKSGKMKVYDAQSYQLRPWFGEDKEDGETITASDKELTYMQKSDRLTEAFGSSRKQRALESRLRSAVTAQALETLANKAVEHAQTQPQTFDPLDEEDTGSILPPCNRNATDVKDVYNLDDIISPMCMKMLNQLPDTGAFIEATPEQITEWRTQEKYSDYILHHLEKLPTKTEDRQHKACILVYMHYLRKLSSMSFKDMKAKKVSVAEDLQESFNQHLLDTFTQMSASVDGVRIQRCFPKRLKEKSLLHMLTLALIIDEFKTDLALLQKGLRAQMKMFRDHARALGCKIKVSKSKSSTPRRGKKRGFKAEWESVAPEAKTAENANTVITDTVTAELRLPSKGWQHPSKGKRH